MKCLCVHCIRLIAKMNSSSLFCLLFPLIGYAIALLDYNSAPKAPVAQWTERRTSNPQVVRSIRTRGTYLPLYHFLSSAVIRR